MVDIITKDDETIFSSQETSTFEQIDQDVEKDIHDEPGQVEERWRGTRTDKHDMEILGKKQVLRRNFHFISILGFSSAVMATWELLLPLFQYGLLDGGPAGLFWGFIIGSCGMSFVYASIGEMASISPTAGGQYHWVSEFAPPRIQKFLSYIVGWLCAIGWQAYVAGACFMVGIVIQGLIALNVENYVWQAYHGTLLTMAVVAFTIIFNTSMADRLPLLEGIMLMLHLIGIFAIVIPLWVMSPRGESGDAKTLLLEFTNGGKWATTGLSVMIGLNTPIGVLVGSDCSVHMSEEINDASVTLPRAMMWSIVPNAGMGILMAVTLVFTMGDLDSVLQTKTEQPFIQVFYNATQSYAATNAMVVLVIILIVNCCVSEVATASRQIWSFARDKGLPGSSWLSQVTPGWNIPLHAVCVSIFLSFLASLINLGSTVALNAINSLGVVAVLSSYLITISCLIWRRMQGPLPPHRWSLGKYGMAINIASLAFLAPIWFFTTWPLANPVTPENMNWSSVMFVGVITISLVYYFMKARYTYIAPVALTKRE
ncbi:amino acid permease protein [Rutstroemia sp. NJR-2017a WRK4]|nr:amino acid permease protein [Rutstroemia sp. NJR-2017a WRK4]